MWDTSQSEYFVSFEFADETPHTIVDSITLIGHRSGDLNVDGNVNLQDLTYLIAYIYYDGPAPLPVPENGDINWDGSVNLRDITYLIHYLYMNGPPPVERN
jgi:hypothetical protein